VVIRIINIENRKMMSKIWKNIIAQTQEEVKATLCDEQI